jgi:hypothetical protein
MLVLIDPMSGIISPSCPIAPRVDEIAYDAALHRVYCASGLGQISVVDVTAIALRPLGTIASAVGAHSIAVDPKTHQVWIAFAKSEKAYVQAFAPAQP